MQKVESDMYGDAYYRTFNNDAVSDLHYERSKSYYITKRIIDVAGAFTGLILLSPIMLITAAAVKLTSKGPVFFAQERVGKRGKLFRMYKFRSMVEDAEDHLEELKDQNEMSGPMFKIKDDPRVTGVGRFIRKTSIDELPQLFNILNGDMSLVGPRPNLPGKLKSLILIKSLNYLLSQGLHAIGR